MHEAAWVAIREAARLSAAGPTGPVVVEPEQSSSTTLQVALLSLAGSFLGLIGVIFTSVRNSRRETRRVQAAVEEAEGRVLPIGLGPAPEPAIEDRPVKLRELFEVEAALTQRADDLDENVAGRVPVEAFMRAQDETERWRDDLADQVRRLAHRVEEHVNQRRQGRPDRPYLPSLRSMADEEAEAERDDDHED